MKHLKDSIYGLLIIASITLSLISLAQSSNPKMVTPRPQPKDSLRLYRITIKYKGCHKSEHYGYAKDKFDADRLFNDSLSISTTIYSQYSINEVETLNKH